MNTSKNIRSIARRACGVLVTPCRTPKGHYCAVFVEGGPSQSITSPDKRQVGKAVKVILRMDYLAVDTSAPRPHGSLAKYIIEMRRAGSIHMTRRKYLEVKRPCRTAVRFNRNA